MGKCVIIINKILKRNKLWEFRLERDKIIKQNFGPYLPRSRYLYLQSLILFIAPWFCSFRLWRYINHLLTYILTYKIQTNRSYSCQRTRQPLLMTISPVISNKKYKYIQINRQCLLTNYKQANKWKFTREYI